MNMSPRKIGASVLALIILVLTGVVLYAGLIWLDQDRLRVLIEEEVRSTIGRSVAIGKVDISFREGLAVDLNSIRMGATDRLFLAVGNIKARLSLLNLILGDRGIRELHLFRPQLSMRLEEGAHAVSAAVADLPVIEVEDGSVTVISKDGEWTFSRVNGRFDGQDLILAADYQGANAQCFAKKVSGGWRGEVNLSRLDMSALGHRIDGTADLDILIHTDGALTSVSTNIRAREVSFPGGGEPIDELDCRLSAAVTERSTDISDLAVQTPFLRLSGKARLSAPPTRDRMKAAVLDLALSSDHFDYEELVRHLPLKSFPDWLTILLTRQIRSGSARLESVTYTGPVSALNSRGDFFQHLHVNGELAGMSFGAGYSGDRITDITAAVTTENGDLIFSGISGTIENVRLNSVDLSFPKLIEPETRVVVKVDLDMPVAYFVKAWRAGMYPEEGFHLLDSMELIESGRISAKAVYRYGVGSTSPQIKGDIRLQEGTFIWGDRLFQNVSGHASIPDFGKTAAIRLTGSVNGFPVNRLDLQLDDPLGEPHYRFQLAADQLPRMDRFRLAPKSLLLVDGVGKGGHVQGEADIRLPGIELLDTRYGPLEGEIRGQGKILARLWPEFSLDLVETQLQMPEGRIALEHHLRENSGDVSILGSLALFEMPDNQPRPARPMKGHIQMDLAWDQSRPLTGRIRFSDFAFHYHDAVTVFNGPVSIQGDILSASELDVLRRDTRYRLSGEYQTSPPACYTGEVAVSGLRIRQEDGDESRLPDDIVAEVGLSFTDLTLYGIPFDTGSAKARLENGRLKLYGAEFGGKEASITGDMTISNSDPTQLDLSVDFRDGGVKKLLSAFYRGENLIEGKLKLQGRVTGTIQSLSGLLSFHAREGQTMKSSLVTKLFSALNVYKIIKSRHLDLKTERFSYNTIQVNFPLKNGVADFNDFYLDSDSIQLSAVGSYSMNTNAIDALVGVQPLETLDRAVSAIPVIGWVLTGDGGKLIVVTLRVSGTTDKPEINLAPVDSVSGSVSETLLRVLKLPGKLIHKPRELITGEEKKTGPY
ncbi:MAG: AsmA-like C-terminal domain-containing protein [Thermodesulfobacteriota bacterium]